MIEVGIQPLVSICMISFNHELYICEAIEGVLMQKTTFDIEVVISEDCSTDETRSICSEYSMKFPTIIRLLPKDKNIGMMANFFRALNSCNGKYIALCEGDDYWTDPSKLQKQVDFLEANPEFSACAHELIIKFDESYNQPDGICSTIKIQYTKQKEVINNYTIKEISRGVLFQTPSVVFRNCLGQLPNFFHRTNLGDLALYLILTKYGNIYFMHDIMGVYRKHGGGITASDNFKNQQEYLKSLIYLYSNINRFFEKKYVSIIHPLLADFYLQLSFINKKLKNNSKAKKNLKIAFAYHPKIFNKYFLLYASFIRFKLYTSYHKYRRFIRLLVKKMFIISGFFNERP